VSKQINFPNKIDGPLGLAGMKNSQFYSTKKKLKIDGNLNINLILLVDLKIIREGADFLQFLSQYNRHPK